MATYLYLCRVVNEEFEAEHSIKIKLESCPKCVEAGREDHQPYRLIAAATPGSMELTGHELVAKTKEDIVKLKKEVYGSEKKYASFLGDDKMQQVQTRLDRSKKGY